MLEAALPQLREAHPTWGIEVLYNRTGTIPQGLNTGIFASRGDQIVRLDIFGHIRSGFVPGIEQGTDSLEVIADRGFERMIEQMLNREGLREV